MGNEILHLTILTTGGTIEKVYNEFEGTLDNRETIVKNKILQKLRHPYTWIEVYALMSKDSLMMDDHDRQVVRDAVKEHEQSGRPIIILHGTDTMDQSAKFCFDRHQDVKVPVVFTGAVKPLGFEDSDATQNVIEAVYAARILKPGYYITFHGRLYNVPHVRKNKVKGTFEEIV